MVKQTLKWFLIFTITLIPFFSSQKALANTNQEITPLSSEENAVTKSEDPNDENLTFPAIPRTLWATLKGTAKLTQPKEWETMPGGKAVYPIGVVPITLFYGFALLYRDLPDAIRHDANAIKDYILHHEKPAAE